MPVSPASPKPAPVAPESSLAVQWWPIEKLCLYTHNPRRCSEEAVRALAASISEFGWKVPLVIDAQGTIVAGHTRYRAAQYLGAAQVPVIVATDLSPAQLKAYRLADNKLAELTSWDPLLLSLELSELIDMEIDPTLAGFSAAELSELLAPPPTTGLSDPDALLPPPAEPITKPGELWLLGTQRLLCGDATKAADVQRLMGGQRAALMVTDPPYLIDYEGGKHPQSWGNGGKQAGRDVASKSWDAYIDPAAAAAFYVDFLRAALRHALMPDAAIYQCFAILRSELILSAWQSVGLHAHQVCIWKKSRAVLTHSWFLWDYEPLLIGWPAGRQPKSKPPADTKAVWEIASTEGNEAAISSHPTVKPVALLRRPIEWHSKPGGLIYEPFCGSGTALIAAEMSGRRCYAIELSAAFCDAAILRWQAFTGKLAVREGRP